MPDQYDFAAARAIQCGALTDAPDELDPESWSDAQRVRWYRRRRGEDWLYAATWWCGERWGWVGQAALYAADELAAAPSEGRFRSQAEAAGDALRRLQMVSGEDVLALFSC